MADFNTTVEITESSEDDYILLRHEGRDRKQKRDVFAAGISNARWRKDVNYEKGSIVVASDFQAYVALAASGVDFLQPEDPVANLGKWQLVVNKPDEYFINVPDDEVVSDGEEFLVNKSGETHKYDQDTLTASVANGRWVSTAQYKAGSEVVHGTEKYLALSDNTNVTPSFANRATWFKLKRYVDTTGMIHLYTSTLAPAGRLLKANGAVISRSQFPELFAKIGTIYGAGNGTTTFNLPDLRGEFMRFYDDGRGVDAGRGLGGVQMDSFKSHLHENTGSISSTNLGTKTSNTTGNHNHSGTVSSEGNHYHQTLSNATASPSSSSNITSANYIAKGTSGGGGFDEKYVLRAAGSPPSRGRSSTTGAHTHTLSINSNGNHSHTVNIGTHGHTLTLNNSATGSTETRPRNVALVAYIEY